MTSALWLIIFCGVMEKANTDKVKEDLILQNNHSSLKRKVKEQQGFSLTNSNESVNHITFSDVPVYESTLGVHKIELMIQTRPSFSNGCGVRQHAYCTLHLGEITSRYDGRWLVVDT